MVMYINTSPTVTANHALVALYQRSLVWISLLGSTQRKVSCPLEGNNSCSCIACGVQVRRSAIRSNSLSSCIWGDSTAPSCEVDAWRTQFVGIILMVLQSYHQWRRRFQLMDVTVFLIKIITSDSLYVYQICIYPKGS